MTEEKKYITFKDLRAVSSKNENRPGTTSIASTPSISSDTSSASTTRYTSTAPVASPAPIEQKNKQTQPESTEANRPVQGVAPERDFQRVPNSITRRALAEGSFKGKSKQVWDYLWSVTRGAVVPSRTVRKSRREIKAGSGLGSMVTVDAALEHLQNVGLIAIRPLVGSLVGNEYEIFTPEEASTSISSISSTTSLTQKLDILDILDSSISSTTQTIENTRGYAPPKTSFKTNTERSDDDDDAALAAMIRTLKNATKEITGKDLSSADGERWNELAEVLVAELKIAAARTTVSSVPAFLTEHLRRRLWKIDKKQARAEGRELPDESATQAQSFDATECPDCGGSGWWYPEGESKGVAKCKHVQLKHDLG